MELRFDAMPDVWRHIPALIMVMIVPVRLADEARQRRRLAENLNLDATQNDYTNGGR